MCRGRSSKRLRSWKKMLLNVNFQPLKLKLLISVEKKFSKLLVFKKRNKTLSPPEVSMVSFNTFAINKYIKNGFWNTMDTN